LKPAILKHLIERAVQQRDAAQRAMSQLEHQQRNAAQTLNVLTQFRTEGQQRGPVRGQRLASGALMQQATEFDERMLQAMARQEHQCQTLSADVRQQREVLLALQQRAMALEALAERHARAQRARAAKLEQKRTDEFATQRAARRAAHNEQDHSSNQP